MRILAEIVLVAVIIGGAIVFFRAIWKLMDKTEEKQGPKKKGGA
jgi:TRAP-type C4-dicarboxylate transport system permease small subunit